MDIHCQHQQANRVQSIQNFPLILTIMPMNSSSTREPFKVVTNSDRWAPKVDPFVETEETRVTCALSLRLRRRAYTTHISFRRETGDACTNKVSPFIKTEETRVRKMRLLSSRNRRCAYTESVSFNQDRGDARAKDVSTFVETEETHAHSTRLRC
jgi:hypothetical protein